MFEYEEQKLNKGPKKQLSEYPNQDVRNYAKAKGVSLKQIEHMLHREDKRLVRSPVFANRELEPVEKEILYIVINNIYNNKSKSYMQEYEQQNTKNNVSTQPAESLRVIMEKHNLNNVKLALIMREHDQEFKDFAAKKKEYYRNKIQKFLRGDVMMKKRRFAICREMFRGYTKQYI